MNAITTNAKQMIAATKTFHANENNPYEISFMLPLPAGYYVLEYIPDDGRGCPSHIEKTPIIGMAHVFFKNKRCLFPVTLLEVLFHEENNAPTILCPCGGVQSGGEKNRNVFFDSLDDFMEGMDYIHKYHMGHSA